MVKHVLSEIPSKEYMISDERKAELDAMYSPQAEVARLRAALDEALEVVKPFGDRAVAWKHNADSARVSVRLADLRAARRFYEKHKGGWDG